MTVRTVLWDAKPHTLAKHEILRRYLGAWFNILCKTFRHAVYIDGYCGPGEYKGGEPGSPVIALDIAESCEQCRNSQLSFYFIDDTKSRINNLNKVLAGKQCRLASSIAVLHGDFADQVQPVLNMLPDRKQSTIPVFSFLDPFGVCIPLSIIQRLLSKPSSEAFIYFSALDAIRNVHNESERNRLDAAFGTCGYAEAAHAGDKKALLDLYMQQLKKSAEFLIRFEMRDTASSELYSLIFASNSEDGFYKMKEAMWSVSNAGVFAFTDAYSENQPALFGSDEPAVQAARDLIVKRLVGKGKAKCFIIRRFIKYESYYLEKHMNAALIQLESEKLLVTCNEKELEPRRRKNFFPDELDIIIHSQPQGQNLLKF